MPGKDLFVRRAYTHKGITVLVQMDFIKKTVSLVEKNGAHKQWVFSERTPEYMPGWIIILDAMKNAILEAKKEMDAITEQEHEDFVKMFALDKALGNGGKP